MSVITPKVEMLLPSAAELVTFGELRNASTSAPGQVKKTSPDAWDGSAAGPASGTQTILFGEEGEASTIVTADTKWALIGLSKDIDAGGLSYEYLDYAVYVRFDTGTLLVFENGTPKYGGPDVPYVIGDKVTVRFANGVVTYLKNDSVFYESLVVPTEASFPLRFAVALAALDSELTNCKMQVPRWVDVSEDVVSDVVCDWGIHGDAPKDRLADPGAMSFDLDNSASNSDGTRGYYSCGHDDVREGFGIGALVRMSLTHALYGTKVKWVGTVESAWPLSGARDPRTIVRCSDWMEEATRSKLHGLPVQTDTQSDELFSTIIAAMDKQPPGGTSVGSGSDEYPFALDNVQDEKSKVSGELLKIAMSEYGIIYVDAGVLYFEGRRRRGGAGGVRFALDETNITKLRTTHDRVDVLNRVQVSIHPRRRDSAATTELFDLGVGSATALPIKTEIVLDCPYRDPNQPAERTGGVDMVTPEETEDYLFNSQEDGGGANLSAQLTVEYVDPPPGGNSAKVRVYNDGPLDGYLVRLKLRGRGIYDFRPVLSDVRDQDSIDQYGENAFSYDMPHQSLPANARDTAQFILALHKDEGTRARTIQFVANWSDENVEQAFNLRVSDKVSVTVAELGFDAVQFFVNGFKMRVKPSGLTVVTLDLTPVDTTQFWLLGIDGRTELDETTVLGYGFFIAGWVLDTSQLGTDSFLN